MPGVGNGAGRHGSCGPGSRAGTRAHGHTRLTGLRAYGPPGTEPSPHATATATANRPFRQIP